MATVSPSIEITIAGDGMTPFNQKGSFTLENKIEETYKINSLDPDTEVTFDNVENLRIIMFRADGDFEVEFSKDTGTNIISFPSSSSVTPMVIPITSDFLTTLDSIKIRTSSTSDIKVTVGFYGIVE